MINNLSYSSEINDYMSCSATDEKKLNEYSQIIQRCEKCGETKAYRVGIYEVNRDCYCVRQERKKIKMEQFKKISIFDKRSETETFKNAKIKKIGVEYELYQKIKKYVSNFDEILKINDGLLFKGNVGTGKTFLANCICNYLREKNYAILSFKLADYLRILREDFEKKTGIESKLIDALKEADLVFIDDLGSEKLSEEWGKEKIFSLIDTRYGANKPILITTNLTAEELRDFLKFRNTDKILDRINEMVKCFDFTWESKRKTKPKSFWEDI